ncbi:MAG: OB-fold domain-containing protein [Gammaproteobacteria bacterium]
MDDDDYFWAGTRAGRLLLQKCSACGRLRHPPVPMCAACHSLRWAPHAACGRGTVHTWIISRHPSEPQAAPRLVAVIELEEGVRLVSNLTHIVPAEVRIDMPVELCFAEQDGRVLPQFRPARPFEG